MIQNSKGHAITQEKRSMIVMRMIILERLSSIIYKKWFEHCANSSKMNKKMNKQKSKAKISKINDQDRIMEPSKKID